jgi:hypothetical protein
VRNDFTYDASLIRAELLSLCVHVYRHLVRHYVFHRSSVIILSFFIHRIFIAMSFQPFLRRVTGQVKVAVTLYIYILEVLGVESQPEHRLS